MMHKSPRPMRDSWAFSIATSPPQYKGQSLDWNIMAGKILKIKTPQNTMFYEVFLIQRRARDSNPQPLAGYLSSSEAAHQFAYPPTID